MTKPSPTSRTIWQPFPQVRTLGLNFLRYLGGLAGSRGPSRDQTTGVSAKMQGPIVWLGDLRTDNDARSLGSDLPAEINDQGDDPTSFGR
jgi:hypothetical protein